MPAPYAGHDLKVLYFTVAPWMIGCFLDLLTQGVLFCQFNNYIHWFKDDGLHLRVMVYVLLLLNVLKCADSCAVVWMSFVAYFGDLQGASLLGYVAWWNTGVPLMGACINFYAQLYFLFRLRAISMRSWVVYPISLVVLFSWLTVIIATIFIKLQAADAIEHWFAAHLSATFASDVLITGATAFFLLRYRKHAARQTIPLIDTLVRLTWQTAAPAALCAMANLILSQAVAQEFLVSTIPNMLLPKIYSIAMMWTINSRKDIRHIDASAQIRGAESTLNSASRRIARSGGVELSGLKPSERGDTLTHVEWVQHRSTDTKGDTTVGDAASTAKASTAQDEYYSPV